VDGLVREELCPSRPRVNKIFALGFFHEMNDNGELQYVEKVQSEDEIQFVKKSAANTMTSQQEDERDQKSKGASNKMKSSRTSGQ
jgi:hypothetical protein